ALERGVLLNDPTDKVVRLTPPLVITDEEVDRAVSILEEVWDEIGAS
ncbi:MAG: Aminotransferase class-III, partial [Actinomycetota bacterium]|nr:Aminotransferase class-III [Actinomycetota bacterium]